MNGISSYRENQVLDLHGGRRNQVAQVEVVVAQELREVVQQHQQDAHDALVQESDGVVELDLLKVWANEFQDENQQPVEHEPAARGRARALARRRDAVLK